jgi:hypothetical protein
MMAEKTIDLDHRAGDARVLAFPAVEGAHKASWSLTRVVGFRKADRAAVIRDARMAPDAIEVPLRSTDTASLEPGRYVHALRVSDGAGNWWTAYSGTVTVQPPA